MKSIRLDQLMVQQGLADSREKAQRLILAGKVQVAADAVITVAQPERFVSRGGEKLEAAFAHWSLDVTGEACLDIGASTGGFTDCLLQHGARLVYAVDVGHGQLHERLRTDPRVHAMDRLNARQLDAALFPEQPSFATIDASFISLTLLLPAVTHVLTARARLVTLIKPQFEAGRADVGRGGVVRDEAVHRRVVEEVHAAGVSLGWQWVGSIESPLRGPAGNVEFLAYWTRP